MANGSSKTRPADLAVPQLSTSADIHQYILVTNRSPIPTAEVHTSPYPNSYNALSNQRSNVHFGTRQTQVQCIKTVVCVRRRGAWHAGSMFPKTLLYLLSFFTSAVSCAVRQCAVHSYSKRPSAGGQHFISMLCNEHQVFTGHI
jgi:hypothetical protein